MKINKSILPVVISLVVGIVIGGLVFRSGSGSKSGKEAEAPPKDEIWTCSMHPNVKAPKFGLCPICAMDLIPLSSMGPAGGERDYTMSEAAKKLAGITTVPVIRKMPEAQIRLFGKVMYDESRIEGVSARFDGRIDKLFVNFTGVRVEEGQHLGEIYSPDLLTAQSELLTAKKFGNASSTRLARDKLRLWGFSRDRIRQIESTGKVLDVLTIDAPTGGIVTHLNVSEGDYVKTGMRFFQIADVSQVWVSLQAYESDLPWLRYGQTVDFTVESYPGKTFQGTISFIPPELDMKTRTVSVRVNVPNPEEKLKPGMFVKGVVKASLSDSGKVIDPSLSGKWISPMHPEIVKDGPGKCDICGMDLVPAKDLGYASILDAAEGTAPMLVPTGAVINTGKRSIVYVQVPDKEDPTFEGRDILLGPKTGDYYIVEAGLKEGENVVAEGGFVIDSALQIQAKTSMMLPGEGKPLFRKVSVPDSFLTGTDNLIQNYYSVQSALAGDAFEAAQKSGMAGAKNITKVPLEKASSDATEVWQELSERLNKSFDGIYHSKSIDDARLEFKNLTALTNELVQRFGTAHLPVHEMHCPMAFNDTGASWYQPDKNLLNPYFGAAMLQCGTVEETLSKGSPFPLPPEGSEKIRKITKIYFQIAGALANDDNPKAAKLAGELKTAVLGFNREVLKDSLSPDLWNSISTSLTKIVDRMTGEESITLNRVHFSKLSDGVKSLVGQFGGGLPFPVNEAHCPMAFNDEGANWLTDGKEIFNPYFGAKMLKCGDIVETIHQPKQ